MKKFRLIFLIAAAAAVYACSQAQMPREEEQASPAGQTDSGTAHIPTGFRAVLPGQDTKTAVEMSSGRITWVTDDPIMVSNGNGMMTMYVEQGGSTEAELYAVDGVIEGNSFYAVYPAGNGGYSSGIFQSFIPTRQTYVKGGFATESFPMVAIGDDRRYFAFRNAASLLRIDTSSELFEGVSISSVTVSADQSMAGAISVSYTGGSDPVVDCTSDEKQITIAGPEEGIPFGEPIYAIVAPGAYSNLRVRLALSNGLNYVQDLGENISVDRSAYRRVSVVMKDNYTDLSKGECANCYMITTSGSYKFRADVKGNGVTTSCGLPALTKGIADVKLYYSDGDGFVDGNFALLDNYIYFSTVEGYLPSGTSLLSALDTDGKVLWSWHIWANPEIGDVTLSDGSTWLNMNLGAHQEGFNKDGYNGYYYQWGRKDPFLQKYTTSTAASVLAPFVSHASATDGSLSNSIANPHIFYGGYHPSGVTETTEDWASYEDEDLVYDWWNKNVTQDKQYDVEAAKTMFDPCPAGYHVPVYSDLESLLTLTKNDVVSSKEGRTVEGKLFFPYTSYRYVAIWTDWWPGGSEASRIFIPCSNPYDTGSRTHRRISRLYMTSSPSQGITNSPRSYGLTVRCIKTSKQTGPVQETAMDGSIENLQLDDWE
ncbi:MAG: hypothetical protein IJ795_02675 [Bacteroidales bacterium]|nr:hypothetical protein [Bacteroidales bacterium]